MDSGARVNSHESWVSCERGHSGEKKGIQKHGGRSAQHNDANGSSDLVAFTCLKEVKKERIKERKKELFDYRRQSFSNTQKEEITPEQKMKGASPLIMGCVAATAEQPQKAEPVEMRAVRKRKLNFCSTRVAGLTVCALGCVT